ncbi:MULTISPECIES: hypothetical protein [unclassified Mesorhizobium]|uniref:hypothetical protein n=1 Tax=unclassified Mesorhizobium TaxID=325217 RepID=UPI001129E10C|nr:MULTISPECIES: hypothetical protein [unclassified Mesorhizobium]MBZ9917191.1 hypothetical protein [Mesorhizobium sp. BR1-1-7]MBZ9951747.1 hypothetical protein [Mesorhizobium sp. BR1-1-15]MBZ9972166.1 hypothetical protein [Mesorhizobium sp. BR1-1-12]TPN70174.1 hypothetical protein FJ986_05345 [Mesorhizobium sp. B1-1-1]
MPELFAVIELLASMFRRGSSALRLERILRSRHKRLEDEYGQEANKKHGGDHDTPGDELSGTALLFLARQVFRHFADPPVRFDDLTTCFVEAGSRQPNPEQDPQFNSNAPRSGQEGCRALSAGLPRG